MNKLGETVPTIENTAAFESEHTRTHRRWASTVLALYGLIVSLGIIGSLVHSLIIADSKPPPMQLQTKAPIQ